MISARQRSVTQKGIEKFQNQAQNTEESLSKLVYLLLELKFSYFSSNDYNCICKIFAYFGNISRHMFYFL